ncbi:MAG: DEAD/DEAH box helicase family protein, partial [Mycobacteriales bacterium]
DEPALARAGLRLVHAGLVALPVGARLREQHLVSADGQDWAALLGAYAGEHLADSTAAEDIRLRSAIRRVLPGLGWLLTVRGLRATTSPVDRVCALSASKSAAAVHILEVEAAALGPDLRAVVLCDFEQRSAQQSMRLDDVDAAGPSGSARLAFLVLAYSDLAPQLRPVLVTGRTVAMRREDLASFRAFVPPGLADRLLDRPLDGVRSLVTLTAGPGWSARTWTPLLTDWLVAGGSQVVVGTRGLLGEGWDCPPLNVVIDLSSAATGTSVTQLRGRSLRLDPARPDKVADNWTVACVADDHPRGDADYLRAVRKHEHHLAPTRAGLVESGIGHCDELLEPYAAPTAEVRAGVNGRALSLAGERHLARQAWAVGEPYAGLELRALRVRADRSLGLPGRVVPAALLRPRSTMGASGAAPPARSGRPTQLWPLPLGAAAAVGGAAGVAQSSATGLVSGLVVGIVVTGGIGARRYARQLRALEGSGGADTTLRQLADAVADALRAAGGTSAGAKSVRIASGKDGWLACELEGPFEESELFATCLDELIAPLAEPRWLVSRLVLPVPAARVDRQRLARARALGRPVEAAVSWHAVPTWLGRNKGRVAAFDASWRAHVGAGRLVRTRDPEGAALLELLRGEDPFAVTSRLRTVWR